MKDYLALLILLLYFGSLSTLAQTTEFTYQGKLQTSGSLANGSYDFEFRLYDAASDGGQVSSTLSRSGVVVNNGVFTVPLDFGPDAFPGAARWIEIWVRPNGDGGFQQLLPRSPISSTPYAIKSLNADSATNATQLGGVVANQYVVTTDPRMTDARTPTAGSGSYIQNQNTIPQSSSNFRIDGVGEANVFSAATHYNIGSERILSIGGNENLFAGVGSGEANTTGQYNSFFGRSAGTANTSGESNSYFGFRAGMTNTVVGFNSFFGAEAGKLATNGSNSFFGAYSGKDTTTGNLNSFFGAFSGYLNTTGLRNSFFGMNAGRSNESGNSNAFFGYSAGQQNTTGQSNAFFGDSAGRDTSTGGFNSFFGSGSGLNNEIGQENVFVGTSAASANTSGSRNVFVGRSSGQINSVGNDNTLLGFQTNLGANNLSFATAIGSGSVASASNTITLGRSNGLDKILIPGLGSAGDSSLCINSSNQISTCSAASVPSGSGNYIQNQNAGAQATSNFNISGDGTAGGTLRAAIVRATQFNIGNERVLSTAGIANTFVGVNTGTANGTGNSNVFIGTSAGAANTTGSSNVFVGSSSGNANEGGSGNSFFGRSSGDANTNGNDNSFFGRSAGFVNVAGHRNSFFGRSAGASNTASDNSFYGYNAGATNTLGTGNTFVGNEAGSANTTGVANTFIGYNAGFSNLTGGGNTVIGTSSTVDDGVNFSTAIGSGVTVSQSNTIQLGRSNGLERVWIPGRLTLVDLAPAGSTQLCRNSALAGYQVADCSSSYRYKENINAFNLGIDLIKMLKPITFDWKDGGMHDLGLGAEDVAAIEPLLVTYNAKGEVEGVKYDRIGVVLVNAVKAQQTQIEELKAQVEQQTALIESLKRLVCAQNANASPCKEQRK